MFRNISKLNIVLFLIIFIEGYVVLASEILAIRQVTSYVGNGVNTVSVIIAAVLMPLAFGYYHAGRFKPYRKQNGKWVTVRRKLISNICISILFLIPALSTFLIDLFFIDMFQRGISDRVVLTSFYSLMLLVAPVFLLGQTIPLISHYFPTDKLSRNAGKILFISTAGSFIGSIFTTIIMMQYFGVNQAANLVIVLLLGLLFLLSRKIVTEKNVMMIFCVAFMLLINSNAALKIFGIIYTNPYNTVSVVDGPDGKILSVNKSPSSFIGKNGEKFPYVEYIEKLYIKPISDGKLAPKNILIIGAAGFTLGSEDTHNHYTYVDIDQDIQKAAEEHFLGHPIGPNKTFVGQDALSYLAGQTQKFDLIIMDAYSSAIYIPEQLVTQDFFLKIKAALNTNGFVLANFIVSPNFADSFSRRLDNSFRSVFPNYGRQIVGNVKDGWSIDAHVTSNAIYSYRDGTANDRGVYSNNHNTSSSDKAGIQYKAK